MVWSPFARRKRLAGIESEADRLILVMGVDALAVAHRMEREANDFGTMRYWASVQTIIARKTGKPAAFDPARQIRMFEVRQDADTDSEVEERRLLAPPEAGDDACLAGRPPGDIDRDTDDAFDGAPPG